MNRKILWALLVFLSMSGVACNTVNEGSDELEKFAVTSKYRIMGKIDCSTCSSEDQMMIDVTKADDDTYTYIGLPPFRDFGNGEFAVDIDLYPGSKVKVIATIGGGVHASKDVNVPGSAGTIDVELKVE